MTNDDFECIPVCLFTLFLLLRRVMGLFISWVFVIL